MLYKIINAVRDVPMRSPTKSVFMILATYTDKPDGSGIFPGMDRLEKDAGYGTRTVERALARLEREGWIKAETYRRQRVKGWSICLDKLGLMPEEAAGKQKQKGEEATTYPNHMEQFLDPPDPAPGDAATTASERLKQRAAERRRRAEQVYGVPSL